MLNEPLVELGHDAKQFFIRKLGIHELLIRGNEYIAPDPILRSHDLLIDDLLVHTSFSIGIRDIHAKLHRRMRAYLLDKLRHLDRREIG